MDMQIYNIEGALSRVFKIKYENLLRCIKQWLKMQKIMKDFSSQGPGIYHHINYRTLFQKFFTGYV